MHKLKQDATLVEVNEYYGRLADRADRYFLGFLIFVAGSWVAFLVLKWIFLSCNP